MDKLLITIDGPAGAGKTTVSRALADRLGYRYIDTGALYRAVALAVKTRGTNPEDDAELKVLCAELELAFVPAETGMRLFLNGGISPITFAQQKSRCWRRPFQPGRL